MNKIDQEIGVLPRSEAVISETDDWSLRHFVWGSTVKALLLSLSPQGDQGLTGAIGETGEKVSTTWGALRAPEDLEPDSALTHSAPSG